MKKLVTFLISLLIGYSSYSQIQCGYNAGFETGTFVGWTGSTGTCVVVNCDTFAPTPGLIFPAPGVYGRHKITSGTARDPICNAIPEVCPWGGPNSMRLGNEDVNFETEDIKYTYTVDPANPILIYSYAVMLEDPNHPDTVQPAFKTYIRDQAGNIVPCSYYKVNASNMRGHSTCTTWWGTQVWYRNWSNVAIDMSAYAGQTVTLYFQTNDCGWGAHFGFAYIDAIGCYPKEIDIDGCGGASTAVLTAPPGFQSYLWSTGERTQSITVYPAFTTSVTCTITSFQGCQIILTTRTRLPLPNINFLGTNICVCDGPNIFTDLSVAVVGDPITRWEWDFGDGTAHAFTQNTSHQYLLPGVYTVSLIVKTLNGCNYGLTKQVYVYPCATISMISHN